MTVEEVILTDHNLRDQVITQGDMQGSAQYSRGKFTTIFFNTLHISANGTGNHICKSQKYIPRSCCFPSTTSTTLSIFDIKVISYPTRFGLY